ncbi:hypothetical protein N2152v2_005445 [Parachlorella kessleri]
MKAPALQGWKRFRFFNDDSYPDVALPTNVTCSCTLGSSVWLGCNDGLVVCLDSDLSIRATFKAHGLRVDHIGEAPGGRMLTVGPEGPEGDGLKTLTLKAWSVEGLRADTTPPCSLNLKLFTGGKPPEGSVSATAVAASEWPLVWAAIGLSTGTVHVLRVDAGKSRVSLPLPVLRLQTSQVGLSSPGQSAQGPAGTLQQRSPFAITCLHFVGGSSASPAAVGGAGSSAEQPQQHLFVVTAGQTAAFAVKTGHKVLEEGTGAGLGCSAVRRVLGESATNSGSSGGSSSSFASPAATGRSGAEEVLVAGPEAVYSYTPDEGRKAAFAIKGEKLAIGCAGRLLVAALPDDSTMAQASASSAGPAGALVRVFDLQHKIVAASVPAEPPVRWIQYSSGRVLVGDATGGVVALAQLPLSARLEGLFKARAFQLALALAESEQADAAVLAGVRRRFGDFLYSKRDYDQAMEQYAGTIGQVEPSYVIQRFLDVQRIHNLTDYLEQLHSRGQASSDHTTLLLSCYTKAKDVEKLDRFIQQGDMAAAAAAAAAAEGEGASGGKPAQLPFDVETAIKVLRGAGYAEHALYVALAAEEPQTYLDILLEDCHRYDEGLEFMRGLPRQQAAQALQKYGKVLLGALPVETTALLMGLCLPPDQAGGGSGGTAAGAAGDAYVANMADFTHLYTDRPEDLQYACVTILAMCPDSPSAPTLYHTLLDLYLGGSVGAKGTADANGGSGNGLAASSANRSDALDLLKRGWPPGEDPRYDVDHVLVVCRMHGFREGLLLIYENLRLYREAAAVLMEAGDWEGLIAACERFGDPRTGGDPQLWHDALDYFARQEGADCTKQVEEVVLRIEAGGLLPPLVVLQSLGRNPGLRLELVKGYVTRQLQAEHRQIRADAEESERLRVEIEKTRVQLEKLQTEPVVFQSSRDSQTGAPLELPSVHFLCGHSFNLRTLGGGDEAQQCPLCAAEHRRVADLRRSNKASAADKDTFFKQLRSAPDGFSLVADYFGRGLLNNTSVSIDPN